MALFAFELGQAAPSRHAPAHSAPVRAMAASVMPRAIAEATATRLGRTICHDHLGILTPATRSAKGESGLPLNIRLSSGQPVGSWLLDTRYSVSAGAPPQRVALV